MNNFNFILFFHNQNLNHKNKHTDKSNFNLANTLNDIFLRSKKYTFVSIV